MAAAETNLSASVLPTTQWTAIIAAIQSGAGPDSRQALERFCHQYYAVVKQFFRQRQCDEQEAQDFTQEFFERKICSTFDAGEGFLFSVERLTSQRFRSYLFTVLWGFYIDKRRVSVRRGGQAQHQPADEMEIPKEDDPRGLEFDRTFALELINRVLDDTTHSRVMLAFLQNAGPAQEDARAEAARQLGMSAGTFKVALHRFCRKLGKLLRQEVSKYAGPDEQDIKDEVGHLVARLADLPA